MMRSCVHAYSLSIDLHPADFVPLCLCKQHSSVNGCEPVAGESSLKICLKIVLGFVMQGSDLIGF